MNVRSIAIFAVILLISSTASAQEAEKAANPFEQMKKERVVIGWDTFELAAAEMSKQKNAEARFKHALAMLIDQLAAAESSTAKSTLLGYAREALTERYTEQIELRRKEISRLEGRLKELKEDLAKRSARAEQVVNLQLNSLELASEGLIDHDQVMKLGSTKSAPTSAVGVRNVVRGYPLSTTSPTSAVGVSNVVRGYPLPAEPVEVTNVESAARSRGK